MELVSYCEVIKTKAKNYVIVNLIKAVSQDICREVIG
jgi:hypothetical protein